MSKKTKKRTRERFSMLFLLAAIIIFIGSGKSVTSSIFLILASFYQIVDVVLR